MSETNYNKVYRLWKHDCFRSHMAKKMNERRIAQCEQKMRVLHQELTKLQNELPQNFPRRMTKKRIRDELNLDEATLKEILESFQTPPAKKKTLSTLFKFLTDFMQV